MPKKIRRGLVSGKIEPQPVAAGVTLMVVRVLFRSVRVVEPMTPPLVAVIVVVPATSAEAWPFRLPVFETLATLAALDVQRVPVSNVMSRFRPSVKEAVAVKRWVKPTGSLK